MPTDADLRLVAQAVGFQPTIAHPTPTNLPTKDDCAARWLLPWLEKQVGSFGSVRTEYLASSGYSATAEHHEAAGESMWSNFKHRTFGYSRAEALFDLCLAIIKEENHA